MNISKPFIILGYVTGLLRDFAVTLGNDISNPTNNAIIATFTGVKVPFDWFYQNYYPYKYGRVLGIVRNGGDYINQLQIAEVLVIGASVTGVFKLSITQTNISLRKPIDIFNEIVEIIPDCANTVCPSGAACTELHGCSFCPNGTRLPDCTTGTLIMQ